MGVPTGVGKGFQGDDVSTHISAKATKIARHDLQYPSEEARAAKGKELIAAALTGITTDVHRF